MSINRIDVATRMSKAVIHNNTAYLCGQVANDYSQGMTEQTISCLKNVEDILENIGVDKNNILSATIYVKSMSQFSEMNNVWDNWVTPGYAPARACVEANMADENILVEVSIIAAV